MWVELGLMSMEVERSDGGTEADLGRRFNLTETAIKSVVEVLSMMAQYFRDIMEQGV